MSPEKNEVSYRVVVGRSAYNENGVISDSAV